MPTLTDAADELRRIEAMVSEQFARVEIPQSPTVRTLSELPPIDTQGECCADDARPATLVDALTYAVAGLAFGAGLMT